MNPTEQTQPKETVVITKMSVKNLGCRPAAVGDVPLPLCHIMGKASHLISGEDKNNGQIWTALGGTFQGINLADGSVYRSGKLFLPGGIMELITSEVAKLPKNSTESVQFAMEIRSVKAANPVGYSYQAVSLVPPTAKDELDDLNVAIAARAEQKKLSAAAAEGSTSGKKK